MCVCVCLSVCVCVLGVCVCVFIFMYLPMQAAGWQAPWENSSQPKPSGAARCDSMTTACVLVLQMGSPQRAVYRQSGGAGLGRACGRQPDLGARGYPSHDTPIVAHAPRTHESRTAPLPLFPGARLHQHARLCALPPRALRVHSEYPM